MLSNDNPETLPGYDEQLRMDKTDLETQRATLEKRVHNDPHFFLHHENLANCLWQMGDSRAARDRYEQARIHGSKNDWIDTCLREMSRAERPGRFAGRYDLYPDLTGQRQGEGGKRCTGYYAQTSGDVPLVTIVTAVYHNDTTFERCIASVRVQTWANVEYIVIDGGSPGSTLDIIRSNNDAIDYWVSEPDRGIYAAMNKGIELARGDYICLLNSDDTYAPDFVEKAVAHAQSTGADIVYTDYRHGAAILNAQDVGPGLLLGHMNICHNTFLTSRKSYDRIGPYDESFQIVSDAVWMRHAWKLGETFAHLPEPLFTLTEGGLSSGASEAHRTLFIDEMVRSYCKQFTQLSEDEARTLYLLRFDRKLLERVRDIAERHARQDLLLREALHGYLRYCLAERPNFAMAEREATTNFVQAAKLCELLDIDTTNIRIATSQGDFHRILEALDTIIARRKGSVDRILLHFVTVFSAPSETFIYDLITRLEEEDSCDNFVLFEYAELADVRPFPKGLQVAWRGYSPEVGREIYRHILNRLRPDAVIAHFAINEHRLHERIAPLGIEVPTIAMCHGIDVFNAKRPGPYREHVVGYFAQRPDTAFTVVSDYLRSELEGSGVDPTRITLLPNAVSPTFFAHRKTKDFYDGTRTLRILSIGRLIPWKGHADLLKALAKFRKSAIRDVHLTIVYGNGDDLLINLRQLVSDLDLDDAVTFEPFVNFAERPDYLAQFDMYVHPSTYTDDEMRKTETFGVALLEAITAGLPIITTNAGGLPEVVGDQGRFAKIVPHGNSDALARAMTEMWRDRTAFADNENYARDRLKMYSGARQIESLLKLINHVTAKPLRVAMFSTSTLQGAGYAAYRVHRGLQSMDGIASQLFTTARYHEEKPGVTVVNHPSGNNAQWAALQLLPKAGKTIFSLNQPHLSSRDLLNMVQNADVISLHWYARYLSAENIATLTWSGKPVVMTIRDMMPLTGGCHFFHGCENWKHDCAHCPQINSQEREFPSQVLAAKRAKWNFENITLVALSANTRKILEEVPIFRNCRIEVIPNSIEIDVFRPHDRLAIRRKLGLPEDRPIIGYVPSFSSEVKGYRELLSAFDLLARRDPDLNPYVMLIGNQTPATDAIRFDKKSLGYIADNTRLAEAYSAADVIVVPSLEETFSNTTAEAISCGVPVVGFRTGAIPDLAIDGQTGYTSEVGDVDGLTNGLIQALRGPSMSGTCRRHAEKVLPFHLQAQRYSALFQELAAEALAHPMPKPKVFEAFDAPAVTLTRIATESMARLKFK